MADGRRRLAVSGLLLLVVDVALSKSYSTPGI
jgi:hypothetical protein